MHGQQAQQQPPGETSQQTDKDRRKEDEERKNSDGGGGGSGGGGGGEGGGRFDTAWTLLGDAVLGACAYLVFEHYVAGVTECEGLSAVVSSPQF